MNLLFLINKYPNYGGAEVVTTILANAFQAQGHSIAIVSFEQLVPELLEQLDDGITLHKLEHPVWQRSNIETFSDLIRSRNVDFIINQWCLPLKVTRMCRKAMKGSGCKLIAVHHNVPNKNSRIIDAEMGLAEESSLLRKQLLKVKLYALQFATIASLRYVYRYSDRYMVLSESFVSIFTRFTRIGDTQKLAVVANPLTINGEGFEYSANEKEKVILFVGRVDHNQKRVERIVQMWSLIHQELPDWRVEIVGDGPDRSRLESLVENERLPRIEFIGFADPIDYYKRASILLLTSEYEGFGLVIVEAMSFGCVPIVLGTYPAVYDIIDHGLDGYIVEAPYEESEFLFQVKTLALDTVALDRMACAAIRSCVKFSLEGVCAIWRQLLMKLKD